MNIDWLLTSKNRIPIQKLLNKRDKLILDVTCNGKYIANYQRQLKRITNKIEYLYYQGLEGR